ncbi:flagellar hook-length control protein FliK [Noviherbaspirillum sp. 1P10PC]|uniref:flagellar hook-length control protein FliK n=1 Tax=Noviherbaspirillum sp. 1P10PC TaxID=3132292 RepID=UPI0039A23185
MAAPPGIGGIGGIAPAAPVGATVPVAALGEPGQESLRRLTALETGKAFQAQVLSRLSNGDFVVGIADTAARMALPEGTRVGEQLSLTMVGREPRPLFLLERPAAQDQTSVSPAARLVSSLMQASAASSASAPMAALAGAAPLAAPNAPLQAAPLAQALQGSLEYSGLFYESHVSQWAHGARSLPQLQREPQMQAAQVIPADSPSELQVIQGMPGMAAPSHADGAPPALDAAPLIRLQLETLEQRGVSWQGELLPGQAMQWEVREQARDQSATAQPPAERAWQSTVRLELPALGAVAGSLQLQGGRLQLTLRAQDGGSAALLRASGGELASALEAAGLPLDLMAVRHEPV